MTTSPRHDAIVRLLETRNEHLPEPLRRSEASSGFVHRAPARESCQDCLANDRPRFGCETCGGRGYIEVRRERDPYATDKVAPYGLDGSKHEATRERDRQIAVLQQQLRPPTDVDELADANAHPWAWEIARKRMFQFFDYAALDRALEQLHLTHPGLSPYSDRGLTFLDERLPDPLRAPATAANDDATRIRGPLRPEAGARAKRTRDDEMRSAAADGATVQELCDRFGVAKSTVYAVVNREEAAA